MAMTGTRPTGRKLRHDTEPKQAERLVYTVPEAGRLLGLGRNAAYEAAKRGDIPTLRIGRLLLVPKLPLHRMLGIAGNVTATPTETIDIGVDPPRQQGDKMHDRPPTGRNRPAGKLGSIDELEERRHVSPRTATRHHQSSGKTGNQSGSFRPTRGHGMEATASGGASSGRGRPGGGLPKYYTINAVAEALHVSSRTVRRWIANGHLIVHRIDGVVRVGDGDLRSFLALHREG